MHAFATPSDPASLVQPGLDCGAKRSKWVVLKFGGTSVSTRSRWQTIGELAQAKLHANVDSAPAQDGACQNLVLIVVSALSGVTDQLKSLCDAHADDAKSTAILRLMVGQVAIVF